ncbi:MAG TPA: class II fructose-bisphosphate aldolase [Candidatus Paceibacterota bacterium]|nr:class II fructose-bisphosphate aldolase [Candidatus Paceibacterota bacterium]
MKTLREALADADSRHVAVGHFNISDLAALKGIFAAAQQLQLPLLIGVSEGEREFIGVKQAAALIKSLRDEYDYPIFLNADHTHSLDKVKEAAEAGFDEIIFDNSSLPMEENIANTKAAVAAIRAINPAIVIEGEIGYIGANSEVMDAAPTGIALSTPEEAVRFCAETGIDVLAPAVGNMHGLLKTMVAGTAHKELDIPRIGEIKAAIAAQTGTKFMTLHGGSGTEDKMFTEAARAGMTIIHVSSELRLAWRRGVEEGLKNPDEIAPYKIAAPAVVAIQKIVTDRLKLFNGME